MTQEALILAIDPANVQCGVVVLSTAENTLIFKGIVPNENINSVLEFVEEESIKRGNCPVHVCIEMIASYGMSVGATVFETCVMIGRLLEKCEAFFDGQTPVRVYRKDIKMFICGSMKAKDGNIRQALIDIYGEVGTKKAPNLFYNDSQVKMSKDIWAALAVCHYYKNEYLCKNNNLQKYGLGKTEEI